MIFNDEFFENLPSDKYEIGIKICRGIVEYDNMRIRVEDKYKSYSAYIDGLGALTAFIQSYDLPYEIPVLTTDKHDSIKSIMMFCNYVLADLEAKISDSNFIDSLDKYRGKFAISFNYKFTDGDLTKIQTLINELRTLIVESELFDPKHKERLLDKLERLQKELYKKMSSLDKFWGLIGEAGIVLGKFGEDAKPFVYIIKQIAQIVWRTQANAEELPSGSSLPSLLTSNENESVLKPSEG